jgi:membrane protease YdiL (CAAX protease family)
MKSLFLNGNQLRAGCKFLAFAVAMASLLLALQAVIAKTPATRTLLQQAQSGTLSAPFVLIADTMALLVLLLVSGFAAKAEKRSFAVFGLPWQNAFGSRFWQGALWGISLATVDIVATYLLGGYSFGTLALSPNEILLYGLAWAVAFTLAGIYEEFLFRGYALFTLRDGMGFWPAAVFLSAIFGALHLTNAGEGLVGALNVFLYALFACFTLQRTGNLWFAIGTHATWDYSQTFIYSVPDSGMRASGQLLHSSLHGPTWLTGGTVGPEGSVIGIVALLLSFIAFSRIFPNKQLHTA